MTLNNKEQFDKSPFGQLLYSSRTTASCKNYAADRIERFKNITFILTILVSLGLIFIPLYTSIPNSNDQHTMSSEFLNVSQIFLAVSILVLSVITSTGAYDLKIYQLRQCASRLRSFNKELKLMEQSIKEDIDNKKFELHKKFLKEYNEIVEHSESHSNIDYLKFKNENLTFCKKIPYYIRVLLSLHFTGIYLCISIIGYELLIILGAVLDN